MSAPFLIIVDLARRTVLAADGQEGVHLTWLEFSLLAALVEAQGAAVSREDLSPVVLRRPHQARDRTLDKIVHTVRRKLPRNADGSPMIKTVPGVGYWMPALERVDGATDLWRAA